MAKKIIDPIEKNPQEKKSKKQLRQEKRDALATTKIDTEAGKYGIDLDNLQKAPVTEGVKTRITEGVKSIGDKEFASDIESFSKSYVDPAMVQTPALDREALKESAKRQRRARWADALVGFGAGLQGRVADPGAMLTTRLERERNLEFQEFRKISEANKKSQEAWSHQYRNDLLDFLNDKIQDQNTSKADRIKYEQAAEKIQLSKDQLELRREELAARKAGKYYAPRSTPSKVKPVYTQELADKTWRITNAKNPYSDLYYKLTGNSPTIINEVAKMAGHTTEEDGTLKRNLSADEIERFSNTLLSRMFTVSTDEAGNRIATPKPGMENYMSDLSSKISELDTLNAEKQSLENEGMQKASVTKDKKDKASILEDYATQVGEIDQQLKQSKSDVKTLLEGKSIKKTTTSTGDIFDDFTKN